MYTTVGHFDILGLQALQNLFQAALEAGALDGPAGQGALPGAPHRQLHLLHVHTLGESLHHSLEGWW